MLFFDVFSKFLLVVIFSSTKTAQTSNVLRPRGVSLQRAAFYDPGKPFVCFDGSGRIAFGLINDDYCDCTDGSDEPGTAACLNGTFHCNNIGHTPMDITSSWVNDGVCDCCDTSDEYASNADCINNCHKLGEAARIESELREQEVMRGYNIRQQMAEEGIQMKKEQQAKLVELEKEKGEAEVRRKEKLELKELAETPEKEALEKYKEIEEELKLKKEEERKAKDDKDARDAFTYLDSNEDGLITADELQTRTMFDTNKNGEVTEDEAKFYLGQLDSVSVETFLATGWSLMKPTYQFGRNMFIPPPSTESPEEEHTESLTEEHEEESTPDVEEEHMDDEFENTADWQEGDEDVEDEDYAEELEDEDLNKEKEIAEMEEKVEYDEETQQLVDAAQVYREEYDKADKRVREIVNEMADAQKSLEKDFGPNDEFRPLQGNCFEFSEREYTYKICPFDYAAQKPRNGHSETRLGTWGQWTGPEGSLYTVMKYTGGQQCWNGPQRSAEVKLSCSTETALIAVSEPNRCEYQFLLSTPAVCTQPVREESLNRHIEL